ncbi:hypothetical protein [Beijerinckia sp. L45]|uniref:hypothetical protein n=1 Tax=Beijerinckia sp. L45 TaxID=1641855 RepID=UPI00131C765D|nr:hypothetical protein [Beijerinckia sp. L45]
MVTIDHLRDAWTYALIEIDAAIAHLESDLDQGACDNLSRAAGAWLTKLRRDRDEYNALLNDHPPPL